MKDFAHGFYFATAGIFAVCALILLFMGKIEAATLCILAAFGMLCFRDTFKGLDAKMIRELFSDDATHQLDPLLISGFVAAFVGFYLIIKLQVAAAASAFGFALTALGVSKGQASGVAKAQITQTTASTSATTTTQTTTVSTSPSQSSSAPKLNVAPPTATAPIVSEDKPPSMGGSN